MATSRRRSSAAASPGTGKWDRSHTTPERRGEQRAKILAATTSVVASRGLSKTTVQHVIDVAGVGRRTFYEHFDDLPSAVLTLHTETGRLLFQAVESAVAAAPAGPVEKIRAGVHAILAMIAANEDLARVLFVEVRSLGPEHEVRREAVVQRFSAFLLEGIARAHASGDVSRPPDELTVFALVSAVEAVALRYVYRQEAARAVEATQALVELVLRAFR